MRAIVMGYHNMGCLGFEALRRHGFEVPAVFTHADSSGEEIWWRSLAKLAAEQGARVHTQDNIRDPMFRALIASYEPDFLFSFYYRHLLPETVLRQASRGALNLHGSLLPKLRGRAPVNWALVNGERTTGVSLHYMVTRPDAGALVDREPVEILFEDTAFTLYKKLESAADRLLDRTLPSFLSDTVSAQAMDLSKGSYFGRRRPEDGLIDWSWDAERIYNLVRAVTHPYPGAFTYIGGERIFCWWVLPCAGTGPPGTVIAVDREGVVVAAGEGAVRLVTLQIEGQPELAAASLASLLNLQTGHNFDR